MIYPILVNQGVNNYIISQWLKSYHALGHLQYIQKTTYQRLPQKVGINWKGKKSLENWLKIKFIKFSMLKSKALFAEISWRRATVLMVASANLLMGHLNLSATQISRCHTKQEHAMLLQGKVIAHMAQDVTSFIKIKRSNSK